MTRILVFFVAFTGAVIADEVVHEDVRYKNQRYRFAVTAEQQAICPKWNPDKELNPPVTAAQAMRAAHEFIRSIETPKSAFWQLEHLALKDASGWLWRAQFVLVHSYDPSSVRRQMPCYILMDGSVIKPRVTKQ